jgi:acetyltransferase-like isoleucine patch superfamily enzyme
MNSQDKEYFVHPKALVESSKIGTETRIWAFAHVMKNAVIGSDCNVCDYVFIENDVKIGDRVTIKNGISIWDGLEIEDDVFIGPYAVFTNDMFPRSKRHSGNYLKTIIKKGASIGANATILCGITLGKYCLIGAGAVVTKNVPDFALVTGNPARLKYWISKTGEKLVFDDKDQAVDSENNIYQLVKNSDTDVKQYVKEI